MISIDFKASNVTFAKDQTEYHPLPCYRAEENNPYGMIWVCWKLSFRERLKLLFTGRLWHCILTFNKKLQPQNLQADKPLIVKRAEEG